MGPLNAKVCPVHIKTWFPSTLAELDRLNQKLYLDTFPGSKSLTLKTYATRVLFLNELLTNITVGAFGVKKSIIWSEDLLEIVLLWYQKETVTPSSYNENFRYLHHFLSTSCNQVLVTIEIVVSGSSTFQKYVTWYSFLPKRFYSPLL